MGLNRFLWPGVSELTLTQYRCWNHYSIVPGGG